ncbi:MAG: UvrD-helicase domain-containing protein [Thermodesulfobacteriota bacterium]
MQIFYADLHIHSRYSRATSKKLSLRNLAAWAGVKGLDVLATGDFTHPGWLQEIEENLEQEESGLLRLKQDKGLEEEIPWFSGSRALPRTKFILCTEISSIYKKKNQVHKIHNLVFMPGLEQAKAFNRRLAQIGNLKADGRPILGLDARDLLEMVLECDPRAFLIPAHIWTPWFSLFGSKSGFNCIEDCFQDLTPHIFALETGLSSDPEMNWLWSRLDRYYLVSNSDAHSGEKLAREANIFSGEPSYETILRALKSEGLGHKFLGTVEFFPEEGKYHLDGHRKCGVVLDPRQSRELGNICPVCKGQLTVGVLNRILGLADRENPKQPPGKPDFTSLIPLPEVLSEIMGFGPRTKTVFRTYDRLLQRFGSELYILQHLDLEELRRFSAPLAEGISRMRKKEVLCEPGFDGQFGRISVFTAKERQDLQQGGSLLAAQQKSQTVQPRQSNVQASLAAPAAQEQEQNKEEYNPEQLKAVRADSCPLLVLAGPGTGKTRTLLGRAQYLLQSGVNPRQILILTFTRSAARELQKRLLAIFGESQALPRAETMHALAFEYWVQVQRQDPLLMTEEEARQVFAKANPELEAKQLKQLWADLCLARENMQVPTEIAAYWQNYTLQKDHWNLVDYADLLEFWLQALQEQDYSSPYTQILVDEVQDLSRLQLQVIRHLAPEQGRGLFAIGDPEQSIYSFRGAVRNLGQELLSFWPELKTSTLVQNYRSKQNLLDFSSHLFPDKEHLQAQSPGQGQILYYQAQSEEQEAQWIGKQIQSLLGGTAHHQADQAHNGEMAPGDIAVLVRFRGLLPVLQRVLGRRGLPCSTPETSFFWQEPRVELILNTAANYLGLDTGDRQILDCPEKILASGPQGLAVYFQDMPPFDQIFWKSQAFQELKKAFSTHGSWSSLLNWIHLESDLAQVRSRAQKVRLLTIHAAKGLEFEAVFLPALEQGILPFAGKSLLSGRVSQEEDPPDPGEERRLFYVALTRTKTHLFLSHARKRRIYGRQHQLSPSSLLKELPLEQAKKLRSVAHKTQKEKQLNLF